MAPVLDLNNVQGDILSGLPKKGEIFFFFQIEKRLVKKFCTQLAELLPLITTVAQCQDDRLKIEDEKRRAAQSHTTSVILEMSAVNIAFSKKGLAKLSISDATGDSAFESGMLAGAETVLGDDLNKWDERFKQDIDGLIIITGSSHPKIDEAFAKVKRIFSVGEENASIEEVVKLSGHVRPGDLHAHEHFGYADGISQPNIQDFTPDPQDGQEVVPLGTFLVGRSGDVPDKNNKVSIRRPSWALDGSFLCFRYLRQLVPEFDNFVNLHALDPRNPTDPSAPSGADFLGARLIGRWKSGAPIDLTPDKDDIELGGDPSRNNNFRYDLGDTTQQKCPFAAHTRKTFPRSDLGKPGASNQHRIIRRGIQFGPEVTSAEEATKQSSKDIKLERGLLFVCYQSSLTNGFQFIQQSWANRTDFMFGITPEPGHDPIIGRGTPRGLVGTNSINPDKELKLDADWVVPRGGEYFFSPSISALQETFIHAA